MNNESTTSTTDTATTAIPCPEWCEIEHRGDEPPGSLFHRSDNFAPDAGFPVMLWQLDQPGAQPGVLMCGEVFDQETARVLGGALTAAGERLRHEASRR